MNHWYDIEKVGSVLFETSPRAKRLNLTVRPFRGVRVAVPKGISFRKAIAFVLANRKWLLKQQDNMARIEKTHTRMATLFEGIDRAAAGKTLRQRLQSIARTHGFSYNRVYIRNQRTRWGSCSAKNNISLNIKLTRLPEKLMDYVIIHELVHTRVKSHGPRFYQLLDQYVSDRRVCDKRLKAFGIGLL